MAEFNDDKMKKVTWLALVVIGGFYPAFWSYLVFGPLRFLAESSEPPYDVTWGGIAFLAVFWAIPISGAVAFVWYVLRGARKVAQANSAFAARVSHR